MLNLAVAMMTAAGSALGAETVAESLASGFLSRFQPTQPVVCATYDAAYHLLGLNLFRVATVEVESSVGLWRGATNAPPQKVVFVQWRMKGGEKPDARVRISDVMFAAVTIPDFRTVFYLREADEFVDPPFRRAVHEHQLNCYDFQSGNLRYYYTNFMTGFSTTNLPDSAKAEDQGHEVGDVLKVMSQVSRGELPMLVPATSPRIHVDIDRVVRPFVFETCREVAPARFPVRKPMALRADVTPAPESDLKAGRAALWGLRLRKIAELAGDKELLALDPEVLDVSVVGIVVDYDLTIGSIRANLTGVHVGPCL